MKPNTPAERLYNGIIKENPTFVLMLGMCPTGYHHICNQWYRNGTYYNSDPCSIQLNDLSSEKLYSGQSAYACIYRSCCFLCNSCTASFTGIYPKPV